MADPSFVGQLAEEVGAWQREGLLSPEQAGRILARYGAPAAMPADAGRRGRLASIVLVLGALLVGIGALLFVGSNWQHLGRAFRVLLLLGTLCAIYGAAYRLSVGSHPRVGSSLIFLGTLLFGANVFLIAQTYHVSVGEPALLLLWAIAAFAMAYAVRSGPALHLAILATLGWFGFQLAAWRFDQLREGVSVGAASFLQLGLLVLVAGELQRLFRPTRDLAPTYTRLGLTLTLLVLFVLSFDSIWRAVGNSRAADSPAGLAPFVISFATFAALVLAATAATVWRGGTSRLNLVVAGGIVAISAASLVVIFHPFDNPIPYALAFNAYLLGAILWATATGIWSRREAFVNIALTFFVFLVVARYFDFFFTLFDRSLVFVTAGLLLLGGGYLLETSRRRLLRDMRAGEGIDDGQ